MRVYVETNFVLELALRQEDWESCERILSLAESGDLELVVPAYSLMEPFETLARRGNERKEALGLLNRELSHLGRTSEFRSASEASAEVVSLLSDSIELERDRLAESTSRLADSAIVVDLTSEVFRISLAYQTSPGLSPPDAVVLATIVTHLTNHPPDDISYLINRDQHFSTPDVRSLLSVHNCALIPSFSDGLDRIRAAS